MLIRNEEARDHAAVRDVHASAFPTEAEARLVDRLRAAGTAKISLVAEVVAVVAGHILFSPVTIEGDPVEGALGLAPVAVLPAHQRRGIGGALVRAGLEQCRRHDCPFVVVLGEPKYYRRFGFKRASQRGLGNQYGADEAFMVIELDPGGVPSAGGMVRYAAPFAELDALT